MNTMPANLKLLLFNKGVNEPLHSEEQGIWEDFLESEKPLQLRMDVPLLKKR
jgi:hypothetical protein